MKTFDVWYFIYSTEFYERVQASDPEEARYIVKGLLEALGYSEGALFIDTVVEVVA